MLAAKSACTAAEARYCMKTQEASLRRSSPESNMDRQEPATVAPSEASAETRRYLPTPTSKAPLTFSRTGATLEEELVIITRSPAMNISAEPLSLMSAPASYMAFHCVRKVASAPLSMQASSVAVPSEPFFSLTT